MGSVNEAGAFIPPLSYLEAQQMPKRTIELFMRFDEYAEKMIRVIYKQKGKP
jgi:hypothetical protein